MYDDLSTWSEWLYFLFEWARNGYKSPNGFPYSHIDYVPYIFLIFGLVFIRYDLLKLLWKLGAILKLPIRKIKQISSIPEWTSETKNLDWLMNSYSGKSLNP